MTSTASRTPAPPATTTTTRAIRSKVGPKMLSQSNRLFDSSFESIATELVQNARRAGATRIRATRSGASLRVQDDGPGIAATEADVLLTLGGSANDAELDRLEQAAGIGFFSLAGHDITVESRDWIMSIPRQAFTGGADATLTTRPTRTPGLAITIHDLVGDGNDKKGAKQIADTLAKAARYSGLAVELAGFPRRTEPGDARGQDAIDVRTPVAFLEHHAYYDDHVDVELPGATVRVCRERDGGTQKSAINFHGCVLEDLRTGLDEILPREETIAVARGGRIETWRPRTFALVDVRTVETLALKLPDRRDVVDDGGLSRIRSAILEGYVALLRKAGVENGLPATHPLRATHRVIPPCRVAVDAHGTLGYGGHRGDKFAARTLDDGTRVLERADGSRVDPDTIPVSDDPIRVLDLSAGDPITVYRRNDLVTAFGSGGRELVCARLVTRMDGEEIESEPFGVHDYEFEDLPTQIAADEPYDGHDGPVAVDDIDLIVSTVAGGRKAPDLVVPLACVAWGEYGITDSPHMVISRRDAKHAISAAMAFIPWSDSEATSEEDDRSEAHHRQRVQEIVARVDGEEHAIILERIREHIAEELSSYMRRDPTFAGFDLSIGIRRGENWAPDVTMDVKTIAMAVEETGVGVG